MASEYMVLLGTEAREDEETTGEARIVWDEIGCFPAKTMAGALRQAVESNDELLDAARTNGVLLRAVARRYWPQEIRPVRFESRAPRLVVS